MARSRNVAVMASVLILGGCAFKPQVQHFGVEYNEALASMANQQTLLNILRASKGMPTHFSSVSRFTGTLSMKATSSVNGQIRDTGRTNTATSGETLSTATTVGTSTAPTGLTSSGSVVTTPGTAASVVEAIATGGNQYTPQVGGELDSGTTFDVDVYDQQKFYQGILSGTPFSTIEMMINQGFEPDLIANLVIARVDIYVEDPAHKGSKKGDVIASYRNEPSDRARFQWLIDCNALDVADYSVPDTKIAPMSRVLTKPAGRDAGKAGLTIDQLALLDGDKLGLSNPNGISADGTRDSEVYVVKPGAKSRIPRLVARSCEKTPEPAGAVAPEAAYAGNGFADVGVKMPDGSTVVRKTPVLSEIVFRSPEGVIRAVGEMIREQGRESVPTLGICPDDTTNCEGSTKRREPIFVIDARRERDALLGARFMNQDYSIPADRGFRSMQVITIIQQLINMQKESSERASSVPVRAVP